VNKRNYKFLAKLTLKFLMIYMYNKRLMKNGFYGLDFGTTNTVVAALDDQDKPQVIPIDTTSDNPTILRSVVYISKNGDFIYGKRAVDTYNSDVASQSAAKRKLIKTGNLIKVTSDASATSGYKPDKIVEQVFESEVSQSGRLLQGIKSLLGNSSLNELEIFGKKYRVEELVGIFLAEVKRRADTSLNGKTDNVVLGRPVKFVGNNDALAEKRLVAAAKIAGFKNIILQLEPVGAAYDFGIDVKGNTTVLVFDFGGGTLDLSVVKFPDNEVLENQGMPLGGDLINSKLFLEKLAQNFGRGEIYGNNLKMPESLFKQLQHWYAISLMKTERFAQSLDNFAFKHSNTKSINNLRSLVFKNLGFSLYEEIDRVKRKLSQKNISKFNLEVSDLKLNEEILREEFEQILQYDLINIQKLVEKTLASASIKASDIDVVLLTGGSSLIPAVRKLLNKQFGEEKLKDRETFTSVASGLAVYGKEVLRKNIS
jgi:hypothetical chaperone protein